MSKHGTALLTIGQFVEFGGAVLKALPRDIDPDVALNWAQNGGALERVLRELLVQSQAQQTTAFTIWRTIKLGTGLRTVEDFRKALEDGGCHISDWASDLLSKPAFTVAAEETDVDLVVVSVAELGFKNGANREEIYERALELRLELCPAEVGPQLRLQYKDQPIGEQLLIGMEPTADSDGNLNVFNVEHDDNGQLLTSRSGYRGIVWSLGHKWVFVLPRK